MGSGNQDPREMAWKEASILMTYCAPIANLHTVPIFDVVEVNGRDRVVNFGTGILAMFRNSPYLLTAGHVHDEILKGSKNVCIPRISSGNGVRLLFIRSATNVHGCDKRPDNDFVDVGAFLLREEMAEAVGRERFLPEHYLEDNDPQAYGSKYLIFGFPGRGKYSKFYNKTARAKAHAYASSIYRMHRGSLVGYDPDIELVLHYSGLRNISGGKHDLIGTPDPRGMSGGGIWRMQHPGQPVDDWKTQNLRLVGIAHTHMKEIEVVRGTNMSVFKTMLETQF